jgi:hypothetical protein
MNVVHERPIFILKVRLPVATSLAWLLLVFFLPLVDAIAYLVLGENRLGHKFWNRGLKIESLLKGGS